MNFTQDILDYLSALSFRNNTNLRPAGAQVEYTQDMINEYKKCANDPIYFIENYVYVIHPDRGVVLMKLHDYQKRMIKAYHENRFCTGLTARQMGKTTTAAAYFVWYIIFNDNKSVAILANKQATADEIMSRVRMAYETLPKWLQQGIKTWNKRSIDLENKSRIFCAATSSSGVRGKTINVLYCVAGNTNITVRNKKTREIKKISISDFVSILNPQDIVLTELQTQYFSDDWKIFAPSGWESFKGVVVTHNKDTINIDGLECTPNHLVKIDDDFVRADSLPYSEGRTSVDVYDLIDVDGGNEYYTNNYISHNCDEIAFVQNNLAEDFFTSVYPTIIASKDSKVIMTSTPNGFNHFHKFWTEAEKGVNGFIPVRAHWWEMPGRDQQWYDEQKAILGELKTAQEIDAEFCGSSKQLLTSACMARLSFDRAVKEYDGEYKGLKIYKLPEKNRKYVMTVDTSRGRHLDSSAFMIFDVTEYPHRIVATFNNPDVAPLMYAGIVNYVAKNYNDAYILVETNDIGAQVAEELWYTLSYENMFWTKGDMLGKSGADPYPGIRTTKKTKNIGCSNLKDIIEKQQLIINDQQLISELSTFIQSNGGSYAADNGKHDDAVMCAVMFAWLVVQPWFVELTDKNMKDKMYHDINARMESDLAMGFYSDGVDDFDETPETRGMSLNW